MKVEDLMSCLQNDFDLDEGIACLLWQRSDIQDACLSTYGTELTDEEADTILNDLQNTRNASSGISWDVVYAAVENFLEQNKG